MHILVNMRGAYLSPHLDRPSCEISATLCLDYKSDDGLSL